MGDKTVNVPSDEKQKEKVSSNNVVGVVVVWIDMILSPT